MNTPQEIITAIVIDAPQERVFEVLTNLSDYEHWNPFIVKSAGTLRVGNHITNTLKTGTGTYTFKPQIKVLEPNKKLEWLGKLWVSGLFDGYHYFHLESLTANQTNLIHGERFSGILSKMMLKQVGAATRDGFVAMNNALKQKAEETN